jgi:NAD(P) transhydrogenase subunit alpha
MEPLLNFLFEHREMVFIIILSVFLGIEVISHVPTVLHTPLMSGANAIHGVVIIGAIIVMGSAEADNYLALLLGFVAVILGTLNVVGGFVVTDRMLEMFKKKKS